MNGDIATIRITVAAAIPVQIHGTLITYRNPVGELLAHAELRARLDRARPREPERDRRRRETTRRRSPHTTVGPAVP